MSLVLLFQLDLPQTHSSSLSLVSRIQTNPTVTVSLLSRIGSDVTRLAGLNAAVRGTTTRTANLNSAISRIVFRSLGLNGQITALPTKLLSLLSLVATDVHSHTLGLSGLASAPGTATLGLDANILAGTI